MWDTLAGLPLHPLVVHAVVVLLPLAAIGAVVMAVSHRLAVRFGPAIVVVAWVGAVSGFIARASGVELARRIGAPADHVAAGDLLPWFGLGLAVLVTALWLLDRGIPGSRRRPLTVQILAVVVIAAAVITTGWTVRTGHTGSSATWQSVIGAD